MLIKTILQKKINSTEVSDLKKNADKIKLEDLIFYKKLGAGQFGSVYLVRTKDSQDFMALKCVSKQQVVEAQLEKHIQVTIFLPVFLS